MARRTRTLLAAAATGLALAGGLAAAPGALAVQEVNATIGSSVSMTSAATDILAADPWVLLGTGANTRSGGSVTVSANSAYALTVVADKATMTEYNVATASYQATSAKSLTTPLSVVAVRSAGSALVPGVGVAAVTGTIATPLATGTGLGTDTYALTLSQPTLVTDAPLAAGKTYRTVLTYTASAAL